MAGYLQGLLGKASEALGNPSWQKGKPYRDALIGLLGGDLAPLQALNAPTMVDVNDAVNAGMAFAPGPMGLLGHTVWHGSPHKFDKFDMSKIGTGEGAQAYGHGLYFAESPEVAKSYKSMLDDVLVAVVRDKNRNIVMQNGDVTNAMLEASKWIDAGKRMAGNFPHNTGYYAKQAFEKSFARFPEMLQQSDKQEVMAQIKNLADNNLSFSYEKVPGNMYKVDIPDEILPRMLDWDNPLHQQTQEVRKAIAPIIQEYGLPMGESGSSLYSATKKLVGKTKGLGSGSSPSAFNSLAPEVSNKLKEMGVTGIRYLDGNSRGTGDGTYNYVLFDDRLPRILERNGVPTGQQPWKPDELRGLLGGL